MASRGQPGPERFAAAFAARAAVMGVLAFGASLAAYHQLYATAVVAAALFLIAGYELARSARTADRMLAQFVDGLAAEGRERAAPQPGLALLAAAAERAMARLAAARAQRQGRIDHLEALVDNVAAALLVVDEAGQVVSANRAARQSLGASTGPLAIAGGLPRETAERLLALPPGAREIVRLGDGRALLAQAALFTAQDRRLRLISL